MTQFRLRRPAVVAVATLSLLGISAGSGAFAATGTPAANPAPYAPLTRPGPPLGVPGGQAALNASITCSSTNAKTSRRTPVLLIPGTTQIPSTNFDWNYERAYNANGVPWCAVTLPDSAMTDVSIAGQYVVNAIRTMKANDGRKIDVLGWSQGGMVPRWALRFWPDTRSDIDDLMAIDPSNHGTVSAYPACAAGCAPAFQQQKSTAMFIAALNSGTETFPGISYTNVYTTLDEVVTPNLDNTGSSSLHVGNGDITNVSAQSICPTDTADHFIMGTTDPVAYAVAEDAFTHSGPAQASRVSPTTCTMPYMPGVDPSALPANLARFSAQSAKAVATTPFVATEPALPYYVYAVGFPGF